MTSIDEMILHKTKAKISKARGCVLKRKFRRKILPAGSKSASRRPHVSVEIFFWNVGPVGNLPLVNKPDCRLPGFRQQSTHLPRTLSCTEGRKIRIETRDVC